MEKFEEQIYNQMVIERKRGEPRALRNVKHRERFPADENPKGV